MESIDQTKYFGKAKFVYDHETFKAIIDNDTANDTTQFMKTRQYLLTYFAQSTKAKTIYLYEPIKDGRYNIRSDGIHELDQVFDKLGKINFVRKNINGDDEKQCFRLDLWFRQKHLQSFAISSDPRQEIFYRCPDNNQRYINVSKGFLHKKIVPYASYDDSVKRKVKKVLNHILNVWCSKSEKQYAYVLNWIAHACTGHKMKSALYLKSGEGTGKSIIISFLVYMVIGENLGLITSRANQLLGFNSLLLEKILVVLEELPNESKQNWHSLSDFLKDLVTGGKIDIEKKYEDMIQIVNLISLMILTNNENPIKFGKDARRYFMCDISHDYVGDTAYFNELSSICEDKLVGEAFFMYLTEHYEANRNFNESEMVITETKMEMKERYTTSILTFVKDMYIKKGRHFQSYANNNRIREVKLNDLKDCVNTMYHKEFTTKGFNIALGQDIPIMKTFTYGKNKDLYLKFIDHHTLKEFFEQKGFWDDKFDKYDEDVVPPKKPEPEIVAFEPEQYKKLLTLLKEIRQAREQRHEELFKPVKTHKAPVKTRKAPVKTMKAATFDDAMKNVFEIFH
jgi:hypothetical protein